MYHSTTFCHNAEFNQSFLHCWKWKFALNEFYCNKSTGSLINNLTHVVYEIGNYKLSSLGDVFLCIPEHLHPEYYFFDIVYVCMRLFSILCLVIAFYLHAKSHWTYKSNHDPKPMLCHMICLCICYIAIIIYLTIFSNSTPIGWRILVNACEYFFLNSTVTWLNVVSFEVWRQFHPKNLLIHISHTKKRFFYCCLYAFGLPCLIVLIVMVPQALTSVNSLAMVPTSTKKDIFIAVFYMGCFALFNFINLVLCVLTLINVRKIKKTCEQVYSTNRNKTTFRIAMNLFIISGLSFIGGLFAYYLRHVTVPFLFVQNLTSLQGFFLLIVYGYQDLHKMCFSGTRKCSQKDSKRTAEIWITKL